MDDLLIRPAQKNDYPQVAAIMQQVHDLHVSWRPDVYKACDAVLPEDEFIAQTVRGTFFVAEQNHKVVGILSCIHRQVGSDRQVSRSILFIDTMAIDEPCRRSGIGRKMFDFIRTYARENGFDSVELQVNARNTAAYEMYKHCGFTEKSINMELI